MQTHAADRAEREEEWMRDERYQQLVELAPDAILVHDDGWIVLANAAALRLAGATRRAQLIGRAIGEFLDPPYLKAIQNRLAGAHASGAPSAPVRDTFRRLDGSEVVVEVLAVAFLYAGQPAAHLVIRDITERLAAEEDARALEVQRQETRSIESIGTLAGGIAHEINNMMAVILGLGEFLADNGDVPEPARADARAILSAGERIALLTRQLLAFSRRAVHRPQVVNLPGVVRELEPSLRALLVEGQRLHVTADSMSRVWVDVDQVEHLVINLILNARDAMTGGGTVSVETSEITLTAPLRAADGGMIPPGSYAMLAVGDTGHGMDAAVQARIFEPFYTTRHGDRRTGLGLAAVDGMAKQNHAYVRVNSVAGNGTTFTVYLPLLPAISVIENASPPVGREATEPRAGAHILVVDDEESVRSIVARILRRTGAEVTLAPDAREALLVIDRLGPPDLVLTDLTMPGGSGTELARQLRKRWPMLAVVFMSGYPAEQLEREGAIASGDVLLQKPFAPADLIARVSEALALANATEAGPA